MIDENNNLIDMENIVDIKTASMYVDQNSQDIATQIVNESTLKGVQDLTHLFNVAQAKKQVIRTLTYNQLLDKITDQMGERLDKRADQFSNKDLLDYAKLVADSMDKAQKQINTIDSTPMIQINQQNNNIVVPGEDLDRDSRMRVIEAAQAALKLLQEQGSFEQIEGGIIEEIEDVVEDEDKDHNEDEFHSLSYEEDEEKFDMQNLYSDSVEQ